MLIVLAIITNVSQSALEDIENQIFLMNCPFPIYDGVATNVNITGLAVTYDITYGNGTNNEGTRFSCTIDSITGNRQVSTAVIPYGSTLFNTIPYGWYGYVADSITAFFQRIQDLFVLISFFVSPVNFNILGYTIADIGGIALIFVIVVYAVCYIAIGVMLYKVISPFSGGS